MKKSLILTIGLAVMAIMACGGGGGDSAPPEPPTNPPAITEVFFTIPDPDFPWQEIETFSFTIGDMVNVGVYADDPELDMVTMHISQYLFPILDVPYFPVDVQLLPSQADEFMIYNFINPVEVIGPAGNWRICFLIVDSKGNESNEYCVNTVVKDI